MDSKNKDTHIASIRLIHTIVCMLVTAIGGFYLMSRLDIYYNGNGPKCGFHIFSWLIPLAMFVVLDLLGFYVIHRVAQKSHNKDFSILDKCMLAVLLIAMLFFTYIFFKNDSFLLYFPIPLYLIGFGLILRKTYTGSGKITIPVIIWKIFPLLISLIKGVLVLYISFLIIAIVCGGISWICDRKISSMLSEEDA
ncbi:MAG: hypothetical protein IK017_11445 [Paludibacteraceae bacterium]|nr:hypothetical protein [Paludibacteraceae bacterium]